MWHLLFRHPVTQGIISGALTAAVVDFSAFRSWRSVHDAVTYDWETALFRWVQGALVGAVASFSVSTVT